MVWVLIWKETSVIYVALKPVKPCKKMGCHKLTRDGYCDDHIHLKSDFIKEDRKFYDTHKKDKRIVSFYNSKEWKNMRIKALERDNYLCVNCLLKGMYAQATSVHHIVKIKLDWARRLDIFNLKSLCEKCHNIEDKRK